MNGRFLVLLVTVIILGIGLGAGIGAVQARAVSNASQGPAQSNGTQSLAQPNGQFTNPAASGTQGQSSTGQFAGRGGFGTIDDVSSSGFVLTSQTGKIQVATNGDTKVTKMVEAKVSDLKVGDSITASGEQQADGTLSASAIQVGNASGPDAIAGGMAGAFMQGGQRQQGQGTPSAGAQGRGSQAARGSALSGTIEAIDGTTITIKVQSGASSKVTVGSNTSIREIADGKLSDIQKGLTAVVVGERNGDGNVVATSVQLLPAGMMPGGR